MRPWEEWHERHSAIDTADLSEVQEWLSRLPYRMQGTVFAAVRGCDLVNKPFEIKKQGGYAGSDDPPERQLVQWLRYVSFKPADAREVSYPGAYMQEYSPAPREWKPSMFGAYPMHWYMHVVHAYEVVGYEHPDSNIRGAAHDIYVRMVRSLHLETEFRDNFWARMTEDRIATGEVVS